PTYGRLSRYGLVAFASSLDQIGVFGRTVEDLALIFDAIAGPDPRDATTLRDAPAATRPNLDAGVQGLRVGLLEHAAAEAVEADTRAAVQRAAAALTAAGALVEPVAPAHAEAVVPVYYLLNTAEASANLARYDGVRYGLRRGEADGLQEMIQGSREAGFGAEVKRRILLGTFSLSAGYHEQYFGAAQRARRLLLQTEAALYQRFDLLLGPTTPGPAFRLGEKAADPVAMYLCDVFTCGANLTGAPALNLPAGRGADGLPRGVQLHAPPRAEARLLQAARALVPALGTSLLADLGPAPVPGGAR
ncbi:MAG TPA: amidase family protein, partial [Planctomycetota bacterium]